MKPLLGSLLPSTLIVFGLVACSAESAPGPSGPCNDLAHDGSSQSVALASNPPNVPLGGAITDGSYVLTAARLFNVPHDVNFSRQLGGSLQVRNGVIEEVRQVDGKLERSTYKYTVANTTLSLVNTCTSADAGTHGYSASATQFELFSPEPGTDYTLHRVFTRR